MKNSDLTYIYCLFSLLMSNIVEEPAWRLIWVVTAIIAVIICAAQVMDEPKAAENTDGGIPEVYIAIEGDDETGYSAYIDGSNPLPFGIIGSGETVIEAKADFFNSWLEMEQLYNKQGEYFPKIVSFNFIEHDKESK